MQTKWLKNKIKPEKKPNKNHLAKKPWQAPTLEDVSAKVMAQPYIRFT